MSASSDEDALLDSLEHEAEDDPAIAHLRESRVAALSAEFARVKSQRQEGFGTYSTVRAEKELFDVTTSSSCPKCIVHFFKDDFQRCRIMDQHLESLAARHLECRFLRIDVQEAPFLVTKLAVKVLPCVIAFVNGVSHERIVGFDGLGGDDFPTRVLEERLVGKGILEPLNEVAGLVRGAGEPQPRKGIGNEEEDDDDDWD